MKRPRVVLADDKLAILESVRQLLASDFDVVATVSDGQAAFDAAVNLQPDAMVLDISMPRSSGLEVAKRLTRLPNAPRIVFLSVHESRDILDAARDAGAWGYVFKRNAGRDLMPALKQALSGQRTFPQASDEPKSTPD